MIGASLTLVAPSNMHRLLVCTCINVYTYMPLDVSYLPACSQALCNPSANRLLASLSMLGLDWEMLENDVNNNGMLYNWNIVFVKYCDGMYVGNTYSSPSSLFLSFL